MSTENLHRTIVRGIGVSPGRAAARVAQFAGDIPPPDADTQLGPDVDLEEAAATIRTHAVKVAEELTSAADSASGDAAQILATTAQMAADPTLVQVAQGKVRDQRKTPARAVWEAADGIADQLAALGGYMAERVRDVQDVRNRVVASLLDLPMPGIPQRPEPFVLLAEDLAPADTALLDPAKVRAIVTAEGGPTSHTAILARSLGIPAVVGLENISPSADDGMNIIVDGDRGVVILNPDEETLEQHRAYIEKMRRFRLTLDELASLPAVTTCGRRG